LDQKPFVPTTPEEPPPPPPPLSSPVAGSSSSRGSSLRGDSPISGKFSSLRDELTPEDATRRSRRRERNKVAATKCRNKKKYKTTILMKVSERNC
jgi:hypothetical protein